jgi:hypothetical protein
MPDVMMNEIGCSGCLTWVRFPVDVVKRAIDNNNGEAWLNFACPMCGIVSRQDRPPAGLHRFDEVGWRQYPDDMSVFIVALRCNHRECKSNVVVLAALKPNLSEREVQKSADEWKMGDAECLNGARPILPFEVITARKWHF